MIYERYFAVVIYILMLGLFTDCKNEPSKKTATEEVAQKPNIVWIVCEDQSPDFLPMYGDSTISVPNLESLAKNSILYKNAFSPAPVCAPARSSLITGMYQTSLGTHNMRTYNGNGKTTNQPTINVPKYSPVVPENVKVFTELLRADGYYCSNNDKEDYNFKTPISTWDASDKKATWRNRKGNQPFFAVFNYNITHESQVWNKGKEKLLVNPDNVPVPPIFPDDSIIRHDLAVNYSNLIRLDKQIGTLIQQLKEDGLYDNTYIFFYGDHGGPFPRYKRSIYETGTKVPLIIKLPKDKNGETKNNDLVSFIDFAPTVLSIAGIEPPSYMQGNAFLGKYASTKKRDFIFTASDRFDECYDRKRAIRSNRYKYIRNYYVDVPYALPVSYRMQMPMMKHLVQLDSLGKLEGPQKLWFAKTKPKEEFYDLKNDPFELNNLAGEKQYETMIKEFANLLNNWIKDTDDLGEFEEQTLLKKWIPDGIPEKLKKPEFEFQKNKLAISSSRKDATLLWKKSGDTSWNIYTNPIMINKRDTIQSVAVRIGLTDSDIEVFSSSKN